MSRLPISLLLLCFFWSPLTAAQSASPPAATSPTPITSSAPAPTQNPTATEEEANPAASQNSTGAAAQPVEPSAGNAVKPYEPQTGDAVASTKAFTDGLESFKKGDLAKSRGHFLQLLSEFPSDPTLLFNLGLVEMTDKHPGRALAYWRKALYVNPGFTPALKGVSSLLEAKEMQNMSPGPLTWIYWAVSLSALLVITLAVFMLWGASWVRFAARRKKNQPASPWLFAGSSIALALLLALCWHDYATLHSTARGTVMEPTVPVYSSASLEAPSLFEFREGDEVVVRRTQGDWLQVQRSATSVGWIKKETILIHSGL